LHLELKSHGPGLEYLKRSPHGVREFHDAHIILSGGPNPRKGKSRGTESGGDRDEIPLSPPSRGSRVLDGRRRDGYCGAAGAKAGFRIQSWYLALKVIIEVALKVIIEA
jgi:hypothetical protein